MTDHMLEELRRDWAGRDSEAQSPQLTHPYPQEQARWSLLVSFDIAQAIIGLICSVLFLYLGIRMQAPVFYIGAGMLSAAGVLAGWSAIEKRQALRWEIETAESVLKWRLKKSQLSLFAIHLCRAQAALVIVGAAILWFVPPVPETEYLPFNLVFTCAALVAGVAAILWCDRRARVLRDQAERAQTMLAELATDEPQL